MEFEMEYENVNQTNYTNQTYHQLQTTTTRGNVWRWDFGHVLWLVMPSVVAAMGLVSNAAVLAVVPHRSCGLSRVARVYYSLLAVADAAVGLKVLVVLFSQLGCVRELQLRELCLWIALSRPLWKATLSLWLVADTLGMSGYSGTRICNINRQIYKNNSTSYKSVPNAQVIGLWLR